MAINNCAMRATIVTKGRRLETGYLALLFITIWLCRIQAASKCPSLTSYATWKVCVRYHRTEHACEDGWVKWHLESDYLVLSLLPLPRGCAEVMWHFNAHLWQISQLGECVFIGVLQRMHMEIAVSLRVHAAAVYLCTCSKQLSRWYSRTSQCYLWLTIYCISLSHLSHTCLQPSQMAQNMHRLLIWLIPSLFL